MGIGEIILAIGEVIELIKIIKDLFKELGIDEKDAQEALKNLKEYCEGPLVDAISDVVNDLIKNCKELIESSINFFEMFEKDVKEIEKTDAEGAKLLREALRM